MKRCTLQKWYYFTDSSVYETVRHSPMVADPSSATNGTARSRPVSPARCVPAALAFHQVLRISTAILVRLYCHVEPTLDVLGRGRVESMESCLPDPFAWTLTLSIGSAGVLSVVLAMLISLVYRMTLRRITRREQRPS
jgi:hypothetical protein